MTELREILEKGIKRLGLELPESTVDMLMTYLAMLIKWNRAYNLTAVREPKQMVIRHLLDSLAVLPHFKARRCIDVGTGGGLPGVVLAITHPDSEFVLLDSNGKKTRFLVQVKAELGLENMTVVQSRVRDYAPEQGFDVVISRAFASLSDIVEGCGHLLAKGGVIMSMKARLEEDELTALPAGYAITETLTLAVPGLEAEQRHLLRIRRTE